VRGTMLNDDGAVQSAAILSCEVARMGTAFMLLREGCVRVGQTSVRIMTNADWPELAALVHLKDISAIYLSYREFNDEAGVSMRTNDVLLDVKNPDRVYKLKLRDFEERCNFVDALADQVPWAEVMHLDAAGVDAIFGTGEFDQDSDAETILSDNGEAEDSDGFVSKSDEFDEVNLDDDDARYETYSLEPRVSPLVASIEAERRIDAAHAAPPPRPKASNEDHTRQHASSSTEDPDEPFLKETISDNAEHLDEAKFVERSKLEQQSSGSDNEPESELHETLVFIDKENDSVQRISSSISEKSGKKHQPENLLRMLRKHSSTSSSRGLSVIKKMTSRKSSSSASSCQHYATLSLSQTQHPSARKDYEDNTSGMMSSSSISASSSPRESDGEYLRKLTHSKLMSVP